MELMHRRALLIATLVVAGALPGASPAAAALRFERCAGKPGVQCATLRVPIDRAGAVPGGVTLAVERIRARRRARIRPHVLIALAGGPGQSGTAVVRGLASDLEPALSTHDLVVPDQRGTGRSGLLRCPALERAGFYPPPPVAAACGERIGSRRSYYTTADSVEYLEALRVALGVQRIALYGVSYGAKVALSYALAHPGRVERLILDSVVDPAEDDPFDLGSFVAVRRVLRRLCTARDCRGITRDLVADLGALTAAMRARPFEGELYGPDGRPRRRAASPLDVFGAVLSSDLDPAMRRALPGVVRAALANDRAPLIRLAERSRLIEGSEDPPKLFSLALFATTVCEEGSLPWERSVAPADRAARARELASALPEAAFVPFDRETALADSALGLCVGWPPALRAPPTVGGRPPDVPALVLAGAADLRTPLEVARRIARRFPRGQLVLVGGVGHSVLAGDLSGCGKAELAKFMSGRRPARRCGPASGVVPDPVPPLRLADVPAAGGVAGKPGRTLAALRRTVLDTLDHGLGLALATPEGTVTIRGGGLRGGSFVLRLEGGDDVSVTLRGVEFVPGVRISGFVTTLEGRRERLRVDGPAASRGVVTLLGQRRFRARLDGRSFRGRFAS